MPVNTAKPHLKLSSHDSTVQYPIAASDMLPCSILMACALSGPLCTQMLAGLLCPKQDLLPIVSV